MRIGFEIEIEDYTALPHEVPGITVTEDGSLRNGIEYVSSILPDTTFASSLYTYMYDVVQGTYSERCGFHFHMDFMGMGEEHLFSFLKRYLKIERTLFNLYPDVLRQDSNFCNLLVDSTGELNILRTAKQSGNLRALREFSKYTALNFKPIPNLGTVEFRAAVGGIHPDEFDHLLEVFSALYDLDAPIPYIDSVSPEDLAEANSLIQLIDTPLTPSGEDLGEHMETNFGIQPIALTESDIRQYLRG